MSRSSSGRRLSSRYSRLREEGGKSPGIVGANILKVFLSARFLEETLTGSKDNSLRHIPEVDFLSEGVVNITNMLFHNRTVFISFGEL